MAVLLFVVIGALYGLLIRAAVSSERSESALRGALAGTGLGVALALVEASLGFPQPGAWASVLWLLGLFSLWGGTLGWLLSVSRPALTGAPDSKLSRRAFLTLVGGGVLTISVGSLGLAELLTTGTGDKERRTEKRPEEEPNPSTPSGELTERIQPAPGTRPEITTNEDFYQVDINAFPVRVDEENWRLDVEGLVDKPLSLTLDDVRAFPSATQIITLSCISNSVGGDLISTSRWTGVRLKDILMEAGLKDSALEVAIESEDGFYESVGIEDALDERTLLVYEMNGDTLPTEHGFPLRIYIPNRYGMKQPKWITRLEVIDHEGAGYWVDRGWSEEAIVKTTSAVDPVPSEARTASGATVPIGGIAYAGERGISKVEVQIDGGTWVEAQLRVPPLSSLTWVQWRYDWPHESGEHVIRVRAYDGNGDLQELTPSRSHPDGATGVHEIRVNI
jgi:DMSO/TMAO reductase YedYZ molybdopterin-dependent catalytic subunit